MTHMGQLVPILTSLASLATFFDTYNGQIVINMKYHPESVLRAGAKRSGATCPYLPVLPVGEGRPGGAAGPGGRKAEPYNQIQFRRLIFTPLPESHVFSLHSFLFT